VIKVTLAPGLVGKVIVKGELKALTGIRIGAATSALEIGGIDNPVLRDPLTQRPYIPGSSLKGKLRSLLTKAHERRLRRLGRVQLHWCESPEEYAQCMVCPTFGQFPSGPGGGDYSRFVTPTRLCVRDCRLKDHVELDEPGGPRTVSWEDLEIGTDLPFTEVKTEVALDVVTAASNPRQMERVPPGAIFDTELLYSVYRSDDGTIEPQTEKRRLREVITAMRLLEDDYLGSSGTRGYGKVKFQKLKVVWRPLEFYRDPKGHPEQVLWQGDDLQKLLEAYDESVAAKVWGTS
jgi:CRISPR-associated protein Csm3